jgi:hypothetical protein
MIISETVYKEGRIDYLDLTADCTSIDQNPSRSYERCLLVALVQTIYTAYGNDSR